MNNALVPDASIDRGELERLMLDLCKKYTGGMSSSVRVETFEHILDGALYTIDLAPDPTVPLEQRLAAGRAVIERELKSARLTWGLARATRIKQVCTAYGDTLDAGMAAFFAKYDYWQSPQEHILTLDYELAIHPHEQRGITKIKSYLTRLVIENRFCKMLPPGMLDQIVPPNRELIFNTFELGLKAAIMTKTLLDIRDPAMADYIKEAAKRL